MTSPRPEKCGVWHKLGLAALTVVLAGCAIVPSGSDQRATRPANAEVILATTTSTQDSGLLEVLIPMFEQQGGWRVKTVAVGTGAALKLGSRGDADVVLVHAPSLEEQWMAERNGTERLLVMHNDFVIVGPPADPAGIKGERSAAAALQKIAGRKSTWISRDDNSGTDVLEKRLWQDGALAPKGMPWYVTSGQGMGATLTLADQKDAYTLSDRATYLAQKPRLHLAILVQGDRALLNVYHVMPVNPSRFPRVNAEGGKALAHFLVAPAAQRIIRDFGKDRLGEPLFFPDAGNAEDQVGR
jgi:tungstate transport system substrate-binding protein